MSGKDQVLILDDDNDVLNMLKHDLNRRGFEVDCATTSTEALKLLGKKKYTVAILDIVLGPSSTSEGVIRFIQDSHDPKITKLPLIISSAYMNQDLSKKLEAKNVHVYRALKKPIKLGQLPDMIVQLKMDQENGLFTILSDEDDDENDIAPATSQILKELDVGLVHKDQVPLQKRDNEALIAKNDINWRNEDGETSLMIFAGKGDKQTVNDLLAKGAKVDLKAANGATAMHYASAYGHLEIVKILLEKNAKINIRDSQEREPLCLAILGGHYLIVDFLLNHGARGDVMVNGRSYLMLAVLKGELPIFNRLLAAGLDPKIKDKNGKDVKALARELGRNDFLRILSSLNI